MSLSGTSAERQPGYSRLGRQTQHIVRTLRIVVHRDEIKRNVIVADESRRIPDLCPNMPQRSGPRDRAAEASLVPPSTAPATIDAYPPGALNGEGYPLVFTHLPKTAGSSFHGAAREYVGQQRWFVVTGDEKLRELQALGPAEIDNIVYCGGHLSLAQARTVWSRARFMYCLRDPWSRVVSHFLYLIRKSGFSFDPEPQSDLNGAFEHFLEVLYEPGRLTNAACRFVCGEADHARAIEAVERHYALVWTMPRIDDAWQVAALWIRDLVGAEDAPLHVMPRLNVAPAARTDEDFALGLRPGEPEGLISGELQERVRACNAEDQALYDWLAAEHEGLWTPDMGTGRRTPARRLRLVVDGQEGADGRGLMVLSALHLHASSLRDVDIELIDATTGDIPLAAEVLAYDEGLRVTAYASADSNDRLYHADLYAAIAFDRLEHLRLGEAGEHGVPCLVARQFPSGGEVSLPAGGTLSGPDAAHDPDRFGRLLCDLLKAPAGITA